MTSPVLIARDGERVNTLPERRGGFVPVPNAIFDAMLASDMTLKQHRVVQAVLRLTFGYGAPNGAEMTITAIARRANMARPHASKAFGELVEAGVLAAERSRSGLVVRVNDPAYWAMARLSLCVERQRDSECESEDFEVEAGDKTKDNPPYRFGTVVPIQDVQPYRFGTPTNKQVLYTNNPPIVPPDNLQAAEPTEVVETEAAMVSNGQNLPAASRRHRRERKITFATFLENCKQLGELPFSPDDALFAECVELDIELEWVRWAWLWFKSAYGPKGDRCGKKYLDWRAVFRRAVREGWAKLWFLPADGGQRQLTSVGREFQQRVEKGLV